MNIFSAIRVLQPLGEFYLTAIPAGFLLKVCFSNRYKRQGDEVSGNQRELNRKRLKEIAMYLKTQDAVFPGTIILAANCTQDGGIISIDDDIEGKRWTIEPQDGNNKEVVRIKIPTDDRLAAVVDGQHRLFGFNFNDVSDEFKQMMLPCAIFLDIPTPQQAAIFATINFNQKPVSKSLTYELFFYDLDESDEALWSPDNLSVFFTRKLNVDEESPFKDHIKVAAQEDNVLDEITRARKEWSVSTATVVEGILSLISSDSKSDRAILHQESNRKSSRKLLAAKTGISTSPPFRKFYLAGDRDIVIYKTLINFFSAANEVFWVNLPESSKSLIRKTAGIQALFRVLKELLPKQLEDNDIRLSSWKAVLKKAGALDFSNINIFESSGRGRKRIQDAILVAIGKKSLDSISDDSFREYLGDINKGEKPITFKLNKNEEAALLVEQVGSGGFQSLLDKLKNQYNQATNDIILDSDDLERIPRYAFDYANGGWQMLLQNVFQRHLGAKLGKH